MISIAIIGIDGSGKSTQAEMLADAVNRHPAKAVSGMVIKGRSSNYEVFQHVQYITGKEISPYLTLAGYTLDLAHEYMMLEKESRENTIYIWDRYSYCLDAYFTSLDLDLTEVLPVISLVKKACVTFYLDIEPDQAIKRILLRDEKIKALENIQYLTKVRKRYKEILADSDAVMLDASKPREEIRDEIWKRVKGALNWH